ncbi:DUF488 family protein [Burkholderia sp. LMU1-1-1.1]|uniref:DUF488 family protein n=1 Tax=Burkholderia sp. LMU1-1-1.1 TaxID=3135266 RepID=UPI00343662A4
MTPELVFTIGHSNRIIDYFIGLLWQNGIACLLDIRTIPKSRHNPQFGQEQLAASLADAGNLSAGVAGDCSDSVARRCTSIQMEESE